MKAHLSLASSLLHNFHLPVQAFNMIDQNRDGFIDNEDLKDMLASLGNSFFFYTFSFPLSVSLLA